MNRMHTDKILVSLLIRVNPWPKISAQPFPPPVVYTDVNRRSAKFGSGVILAATMLIAGHEAVASQPVHRFLEYYNAVQKTNAPMNFWERVACSFLLTRAECRETKTPTSSCSPLS